MAPLLSHGAMIDQFESPTAPEPWSFNRGAEFPGATGSLTRGKGHAGSGAHLSFNVAGGGNYVGADRSLTLPLEAAAIRLWVQHPGGVNIQIRVTDQTGQTLQYSPTRPFEATEAGDWYRLTVKLGPTTEHWGGNTNDGIVHNPIVKVSVLAQPGQTKIGAIDFDDVEALSSLDSVIDPSQNPSAGKALDFLGNLGVQLAVRDTDATGLDLAHSIGFKWVRVEMFWADIETTLHSYDFTKYDQLVSALAARGMKAHFVLCYGNALYTGRDWFAPPRTPSAIDGFAEFARNAAIHFRDKGVQFEIWNEPNAARFWDPPSPSEYAALTKAAIPRLHAGDPKAKVSTGGLAGMDMTFLKSFIAQGGGSGADAIGVHPYRLEVPEKLSDEMVLMRASLAGFSPASAPAPAVWSTECGYSSAWYGDGTLEENQVKQAKFCARQLLTGAALGLAFDSLFQLRDHGSNPSDPEMNFGVLDSQRGEKPLTSSIRTLLRQCAGRTFSGLLPAPDNAIHVLKFQGVDDAMLALWSETVDAAAQKIILRRAPVSAQDYLGKALNAKLEKDGTFSVEVGDAPVYLVFTQNEPSAPTGLHVDE